MFPLTIKDRNNRGGSSESGSIYSGTKMVAPRSQISGQNWSIQ